MRTAAVFFALAAAAIVAVWAWLGAPVAVQQSLPKATKLDCVSYAPFRAAQDPFGPDVPIDPRQIDEDLTQLKSLTDCIRTYSVDHGLDQIAEIAQRHGMKVMQGLWLSSLPDLSRKQIDTAIGLAKRFPETIQSVVVGNEVLLRGEMSASDLIRIIHEVKAQVSMPVTYADVWEFWLRNRDVAAAVDFITIHILPYWEDFPIPAADAGRHVQSIRNRVVAAFPDKEILIGEFGWPSAGRMREGALPSPVNQARTVQEVLALSKQEGFRVNMIEAYDQPWKRRLEGTVGGHWGLFDAYQRQPKFAWSEPVSNHPHWRMQAIGGVALCALIFAGALGARRGAAGNVPTGLWVAVAIMATVSGTLIGWTIENVPIESLRVGDWVRSLVWTLVALIGPILGAAAVVAGIEVPSFARLLAHRGDGERRMLACAVGAVAIALTIVAVQAALGLVFDPRYRDFPFAPLTGALAPFLLLKRSWPRLNELRPTAELVTAATLALAAIYIVFNESFANWQVVWFCAGILVLAVTLLRVPDAPS